MFRIQKYNLFVTFNGQPKWNIFFTAARWEFHNEITDMVQPNKKKYFHILLTLSHCTEKWGMSSITSQYEQTNIYFNFHLS